MKQSTTSFPLRKLHGSNGVAADVRQNVMVAAKLLSQNVSRKEIYNYFPHSHQTIDRYISALNHAPKLNLEEFEAGRISFACLLSSIKSPVQKPFVDYIVHILAKNKNMAASDIVKELRKNQLAWETFKTATSNRQCVTHEEKSRKGYAISLGYFLQGYANQVLKNQMYIYRQKQPGCKYTYSVAKYTA